MLDGIQNTGSQATLKAPIKDRQEIHDIANGNSQDIDFEDVLDIFNPLQHIPIVSNIYREHSQDEISDDAKAVGDIFYGILTGGVFGVLSAVGNAVLKQQTDKDLSEHALAFLDDEEDGFGLINNVLAGNDDDQKESAKEQTVSQNDDYWSLRMKQIFGDDDFG